MLWSVTLTPQPPLGLGAIGISKAVHSPIRGLYEAVYVFLHGISQLTNSLYDEPQSSASASHMQAAVDPPPPPPTTTNTTHTMLDAPLFLQLICTVCSSANGLIAFTVVRFAWRMQRKDSVAPSVRFALVSPFASNVVTSST